MIDIVDNFLPDDLWEDAVNILLRDCWTFPPEANHAHTRTKVWRVFDPLVIDQIRELIVPEIALSFGLQGVTVKRVGINGATPMIESHRHVDGPPGDLSLVWMANRNWSPMFGGDLHVFHDGDAWHGGGETKSPDQSKGMTTIEFVPNRAVLFPSHLVHFPNSPHPCAAHRLRITVGVHMRMT